MGGLVRIAFLLLLAFSAPAGARAAPAAVPTGPVEVALADPIPGTALTYLDLARQVVPDLAAEGRRWRGTTLSREIAEKLDLDQDWPDGLLLDTARIVRLEPSFILFLDLGGPAGDPSAPALLLLYSGGPEPALRDAVDVGRDQDTGFAENGVQALDGQSRLLVIDNTHWNSQQAYRISTLVWATPERLDTIDEVMTLSESLCGLRRTQEPRISPEPEAGGKPASIRVEVLLHDEAVKESCGRRQVPKRDKRIAVTYRWNAAKRVYLPDSKALEKLAAENEKRF